MKKVIRITESDLYRIVKSVKQMLVEDIRYNEIEGSTSSEPIRSVKVITDTGINASDENFKGSWGIKDDSIGNTAIYNLFRSKNLSTFTLVSPKPQYENYLQITLNRYKKTPSGSGRGYYLQLDKETPPQTNLIVSQGNKSQMKEFKTRYQDPQDPQNYDWRVSGIVGAGNGLLALSRAIREGGGYPDKITIGFNQSERTSGGYVYDSASIGNITPTLNSVAQLASTSLFNAVNNNGRMGLINNDSVQKRYVNKSNDDLANTLTAFLYANDKKFVPAEDIEKLKSKLTPYNVEPFKAILNKLKSDQMVRSFSTVLQNKGGNDKATESSLLKKLDELYGDINEELRNEYITQYKNRIKSFLITKYSPEQANNMVEQIDFPPVKTTIQSWYMNALKGVSYGPGSSQPAAAQKTTGSKYDLGSSTPNK